MSKTPRTGSKPPDTLPPEPREFWTQWGLSGAWGRQWNRVCSRPRGLEVQRPSPVGLPPAPHTSPQPSKLRRTEGGAGTYTLLLFLLRKSDCALRSCVSLLGCLQCATTRGLKPQKCLLSVGSQLLPGREGREREDKTSLRLPDLAVGKCSLSNPRRATEEQA